MDIPQISSVPFVDSITRPVFLDADDRQYVLDDIGQRVYGVWVFIDEPEIVEYSINPDCDSVDFGADCPTK